MTQEPALPPLVARAIEAARRVGFPLTREEAGPGRHCASLPGTGRFLAMLAAGLPHGPARIGELGTGAGIGAAWLASAMPPGCTLVTAEMDPVLAARKWFWKTSATPFSSAPACRSQM